MTSNKKELVRFTDFTGHIYALPVSVFNKFELSSSYKERSCSKLNIEEITLTDREINLYNQIIDKNFPEDFNYIKQNWCLDGYNDSQRKNRVQIFKDTQKEFENEEKFLRFIGKIPSSSNALLTMMKNK